jgi:hypothetical protein
MSFCLHAASIVLFMIVPSVTSLDQPFDRSICLSAVNASYDDLYSRYPEYFALRSNVSRPFLTLRGCESLCGSRWGPYPDDGPRLLDWIVPGILLIANLHFVPIGWKRYTVLAHFLGDPIDTMLRLLYLVEDWVGNLRQAERIISGFRYSERPEVLATILSAAGRLLDPRDLSNLPKRVTNWLTFDDNEHFRTRYAALTEAAVALRHLRLHDIRRTGFAIFLYFFQFVVVFVYRVGGSPNPSGGRVSPAMMLSWFLPVVLLSNAIGDYGSWKHSQDTILRFLEKVFGDDPLPARVPLLPRRRASRRCGWRSFTTHFTELACSGSMRHDHSTSSSRKVVFGLIAVFPIALACATAFRVDYTAPTWFSCRAVTVLASFGGWLLSWIFTSIATNYLHRDHRWFFIFVKDILIGTPILLFILLSTAGLFNSCYCVSGAIFRGKIKAFIDLNPVLLYPHNNYNIYPWTVGIGLFLQMLVVPVLGLWVQRQGFKIIWWKVPGGNRQHRQDEQRENRPGQQWESRLGDRKTGSVSIDETVREEMEVGHFPGPHTRD